MRSERGFTLIELMMAMTLGTLVIGSALLMLTRAQFAQRDVSDRVDATQRGRLGLVAVERPLRSMVCLPDSTPPVVAASDDSITFYADFDNDTTYDPEQWRISAVRDASNLLTGVKIDRWVGMTPPIAAATAPTQSRLAVEHIGSELDASGNPIPLFTYSMYATNTSTTTTPLPAGTVSAANLGRIVQIDTHFNASATSQRAASGHDVTSNEDDSVYSDTVSRDAATPSFDCSGS
jgi:prepilin-type N-terminal cleavage/methylation domain-containing protein